MDEDFRSKTLQELTGVNHGSPKHVTGLVKECCALTRVPLKDWTTSNLRLMIGQQFDLEYLIPLALEALEAEPLLHATYYDGDLLLAVHRVPNTFWNDYPEWKQQADAILQRAYAQLEAGGTEDMDEEDCAWLKQELEEAVQKRNKT